MKNCKVVKLYMRLLVGDLLCSRFTAFVYSLPKK